MHEVLALLQPQREVAGIVADRFDRRLVLLSTDVARGILMLVIAAVVFVDGPIWIVIALASKNTVLTPVTPTGSRG